MARRPRLLPQSDPAWSLELGVSADYSGGEGGIRTHGTHRSAVFKIDSTHPPQSTPVQVWPDYVGFVFRPSTFVYSRLPAKVHIGYTAVRYPCN
jgi:hypothetical protein